MLGTDSALALLEAELLFIVFVILSKGKINARIKLNHLVFFTNVNSLSCIFLQLLVKDSLHKLPCFASFLFFALKIFVKSADRGFK